MATVAFYGVLWAEGSNDIIADHFDIPLYTITWIARVAIFVVPWIAYVVTKRICLGLQRADLHTLVHGVETGIIRQLPTGEFIEVTEPPSEDELVVLLARPDFPALPADRESMHGAVGRLRERAYKEVTETVPPHEAHTNGDDSEDHDSGRKIAGTRRASP
jgi:ubiquinol-cytochrome c reductase cytochrome b subunit